MTQNRPPRGKPGRPGDKPRPDLRPDQRPDQRQDKQRHDKLREDRPASENRLSLPGQNAAKPDRNGPRTQGREHGRDHGRDHGRGRGQGQPGRGPATPAGAVWLYGTHAVAAALKNSSRLFRRLVITEEARASLAAECPQPWAILPEITTRDKIDQLLGARAGSGIVHQGIALLTDQLTAPALLDAVKRPGPVLVLDQIFDPRNVGALMRTAQAFGACAVIAQDRNAPEETGALAKAASGALETIPLLRTVNIARALIVLKSAEFWVVGLDGHAPSKLNGPSFGKRRVALVLGSEGEGMRRLTRDTCDEICALAMPGGMESLNVSAAGAVALYEITRRD
jgi:23S rRNA (guanosine2251-2'-O)-methyltransferase